MNAWTPIRWVWTIAALAAAAGCDSGAGKKAQEAPPTQVVVAPVQRQPVTESLSLVGTVTANEFVEVKPEADGTVLSIHFQEGQRVKAGDLLVQLDTRKLEATVREAEANFELSRTTFERNKQLFAQKLVSQQEFDQAAALYRVNEASLDLKRQELKDARVLAPFSGVVGARHVSPGQVVTRSTMLTTLVDLDTVKVEINVPERFLSQVGTGQQIQLKVAAFPGAPFHGEVFFVAPHLDRSTRTAQIKARIPNADHRLKPGMFAGLELSLRVRENALVIPESAVMYAGDRTSVYVVTAEETARMQPVRLGIRLPGQVEVLEGLQEGERVVSEGIQKVRPGGRVRVKA